MPKRRTSKLQKRILELMKQYPNEPWRVKEVVQGLLERGAHEYKAEGFRRMYTENTETRKKRLESIEVTQEMLDAPVRSPLYHAWKTMLYGDMLKRGFVPFPSSVSRSLRNMAEKGLIVEIKLVSHPSWSVYFLTKEAIGIWSEKNYPQKKRQEIEEIRYQFIDMYERPPTAEELKELLNEAEKHRSEESDT